MFFSVSSEDESPVVKKPKKKFTDLQDTSSKMPPKRKKTYFVDSSESDEEVIPIKKKSKKTDEPKKSKKKKALSDSDDEFVPKKNKKVESESDDDYAPKKKKKASPKAKKPTTSKKAATTSKKATTSKSSKGTTKGKASSRNKLVKPMDYESENEGDHIKPTMVSSKKMETLSGFQSNYAQSSKSDGDKKKIERGEMWVDRYRPRRINQIVGQQTPKCPANKLKNWLDNWEKNKDVPVTYGKKNDTGVGLKAALLSGCPGIGKTTTAQLVAKECGYDFVEFNASDTRNKRSMDDRVQTLIGNKSLGGLFQDATNRTGMTKKHLIIMDEVDGMSGNADRGGISELIQFIKKSKIPIICICNDRNNIKIRNLANYCFDLRFTRPRVEAIKKMIKEICNTEGVKVDEQLLGEIIEMSNHDIRQVIHYFSVFAIRTKKISDVKGNKIIKNVSKNIFDITHDIFSAGPEYDAMSFRDRTDLFFQDYQMLPLMAFGNYLQCKPAKSTSGGDFLALAAKSIDAMCIGDLISTEIRTRQSWNLLPLQACFSLVMPAHYMNGRFQSQLQFADWLGKFSSTNKKQRLITQLKQHMNLKITGSLSCLALDYLLPLRERIVRPLVNNEEEAIMSAIKTLNHYCLLKDDLPSIIELTLWGSEKDPYAAVDKKVKMALTKNFNNTCNPLPYAFEGMYKKMGKAEPKTKKNKDGEEDEGQEREPDKDEILIPEF